VFISKRSNHYYYLFYFDELGKRYKVSTGSKTKSEALRFLRVFNAKTTVKQPVLPRVTLEEFSKQYLAFSAARHSAKYQESIKTSLRCLQAATGNMPLDKIGVREIERFVEAVSHGHSDRTVRAYFVTCASAFETARRWGHIEINPFRLVPRPRLRELTPAHFTPTDFIEILRAEGDQDLRELYLCAVHTGMRLGELTALDWREVDLVNRVIHVRNTEYFTTKSRKNRSIPMTSQLCAVLAERKKSSATPHVFAYQGRRLTKDIVSRNFKQCVTKTGLNPALHFHSTRHSFATWLVQSGVSIYSVQRLLGHSNIAMTQVYAHLAPSDLHNAVSAISISVPQ